MRPGGGALEHADRVHQTHERASLDDPRAAAFGDAGNALSVPEVGVHPSAGIEEPHPQEARGALGVFLVVAEVVGERQCADGAAQRAPAGRVVVTTDLGVSLTVAPDIRQAARLGRVGPPVRAHAHVVCLSPLGGVRCLSITENGPATRAAAASRTSRSYAGRRLESPLARRRFARASASARSEYTRRGAGGAGGATREASRGADGATPRQRSTSAARRSNTSVLPRRAGTRPPQSRTARSRPPAPRYRGASVSPTRSCRTRGTRFSRGPRSGGAPGPRPCRSARSAALPWSPLAPSPSSGCAGYSAPAAARCLPAAPCPTRTCDA